MATNYAVAPGEFLREWIDEEGHGVTQAELARQLGTSRKHVNELIGGKAPVTPETALKLERVTSIPSSAWLLYEAQYRDDLARLRDEEQLREHEDLVTPQLAAYLRKLGVSAATMRNRTKVLEDFLTHVRFGSFEAYSDGCSAKLGPALATLRESGKPFDRALMMAWLATGERTPAYARALGLKFNRQGLLDLLPQVKDRVTRLDENTLEDVVKLLESAGVACQFVEPPEKFPLYGVVIWTRSDVPVIQLTGRRKKNCHIIWSLFHELGHIVCDETPTTQLEFTKSTGEKRAEEKAANQFARDWLFGGSASDYHGMTHAREIEAKARKNGHIPCVVVQELHRTKALDRRWCNELVFDMTIPFQAPTNAKQPTNR